MGMVQWAGEHELLNEANQKDRFERTLLRMGYAPSDFCVHVTGVSRTAARKQRRYTVRITLAEHGAATSASIVLEGGHGYGWIPKFAQLAPQHFPLRTPSGRARIRSPYSKLMLRSLL
jgi:hypothetical protein